MQHDEQAVQALHHLTVVVEEDLRHHDRTVASHADQVPLPKLLVHLGDRDTE
jgi:hypothetical protein